jgi:peroxiredoxin
LNVDNNSNFTGMPGAFTPTCSKEHLPGYIKAVPKLESLGIEKIAIVTTNDRFVNDAWSETSGLDKSAITILCDGDGDFVKKIGLADDMGFGIGIRSKRFVLVTENGKVTYVVTDEGMEDCSATSADSLISYLAPPVTKEAPAFDFTMLGAGILAAVTLLGATQLSFAPSSSGSSATSTSTQRVQPTKSGNDNPSFSLLKEFRDT